MERGSANQYYRDELSQKFDLIDTSAFEKIGDKYSDIKITYNTTPTSEKFVIYFPEKEGMAVERRVTYEYVYDPIKPEKGNWVIHHQKNTALRDNFGKIAYTDDVSKVLKHFRQTASAARSLKKAIDKEQMNERKLTKAELDKREDIIKDMKKNKRSLVKRYGKDAEKVMYGRATNLAKKQEENMDPKSKIREMVKSALSTPPQVNEKFSKEYDDDPALKGGQKDLPDALQKSIIDKSVKEEETVTEDIDLGHEDDEPGMLKSDLYRIGKYAMELYQIMDKLDDGQEVDLPHWWQAKVIKAKDALVSAKHFLDFELKEPQIDQVTDMVDAKGKKYAIDESKSKLKKLEDELSKWEGMRWDMDQTKSSNSSDSSKQQKKKEAADKKIASIKSKIKKLKPIDESYMGNEGDEVMITMTKKPDGDFPGNWVLEKPDGSAMVDMFFDSKEEAKKYASKRGLIIVNGLRQDIQEKIAEVIKGAHSVMGDKSKKKKRPSKRDIELAKKTQADYEKSKNEEEDWEGLAARSGASLEETDYKVAGRPVELIQGVKADGTDWKVKFKNGDEKALADVLALIKPKPELTKKSKTSTIAEKLAKHLKENNSTDYEKTSKPRFRKDKNHPNFLYAHIDYSTGGGGVSTALGKETMSGQTRRLSAAKAMEEMQKIASKLESRYNIEDIDVVDEENGKVTLFAVSDDFIGMDPKSISLDETKKSTTSTIAEKLAKQLKSTVSEVKIDYDFSEEELKRVIKQLKRGASTEVEMIKAFEKALGRELTADELREIKETKNTIGLAFKDEDEYKDFKEFAKDNGAKIYKDGGWDSKTKSWYIEIEENQLAHIYGDIQPGNNESGWMAIKDDFESVIISEGEDKEWNTSEQKMVKQIERALKDGDPIYNLPTKTQTFYRKHKNKFTK